MLTPLESNRFSSADQVAPPVISGALRQRTDSQEDKRNTAVKTLVTLATYNEFENLPPLLTEILEVDPTLEILVIDDNSPDGTGVWCQTQSLLEPRLHCLRREGKLGLGSATIAAMRYAIAEGFDWVLNMDADFSHHPRYIPSIMAAREKVDVVIGSRYVKGGGVSGWPLKRKIMSQCVNFYARNLLGLPLRDCSGAFRCYRTSVLKKIDFSGILAMGYAFQEEILWRMKMAGARFCEVPIVFEDRRYGTSKINMREARQALSVIARLGVKNWFGV